MNATKTAVIGFLSTAALTLLGCGSGSKPSATATVGTAGATLKAGAATLSIPAGALSGDTSVTLREAEVHRSGSTVRFEIEPHGKAVAQAAKLSIKIDDSNLKSVSMVDDSGAEHPVEVEDRNHGDYKTTMSSLGEVEVELEHGAACNPACASGQECDDGVCKAHVEDANAKVCDPVCDSGQECDDGVCKTHSEVETEHGGTPGAPATCTPGCATGMECDNGVCKAHGT